MRWAFKFEKVDVSRFFYLVFPFFGPLKLFCQLLPGLHSLDKGLVHNGEVVVTTVQERESQRN
jgi:hypothetical protein